MSRREIGTTAADRDEAAGSPLHEVLSMVALDAPVPTRRGKLPAGARGVAHDRKPDGSWYLVEFTEPFFAVTDVRLDDAGGMTALPDRERAFVEELSARSRGIC